MLLIPNAENAESDAYAGKSSTYWTLFCTNQRQIIKIKLE